MTTATNVLKTQAAYSLIVALTLSAQAGPLQYAQVPATAKWLVHVDVEQARQTHLGTYLGSNVLGPQLARPLAELKTQFGVELDGRKIVSVTLYGDSLRTEANREAVVVIQSRQDLGAMLDAVIAKIEELTGPGRGPLRKREGIYSLNRDAFGAVRGEAFVLSGSASSLNKALAVFDGTEQAMDAAHSLVAFPSAPRSLFFMASAEGFNTSATLPPQARLLRHATAMQVVLGENAGQVVLRLTLRAKDAETTSQLAQLIQGLVAWAVLNAEPFVEAPNTKGLSRLARTVRVTSQDTFVQASLELSAADLIAELSQWNLRGYVRRASESSGP